MHVHVPNAHNSSLEAVLESGAAPFSDSDVSKLISCNSLIHASRPLSHMLTLYLSLGECRLSVASPNPKEVHQIPKCSFMSARAGIDPPSL